MIIPAFATSTTGAPPYGTEQQPLPALHYSAGIRWKGIKRGGEVCTTISFGYFLWIISLLQSCLGGERGALVLLRKKILTRCMNFHELSPLKHMKISMIPICFYFSYIVLHKRHMRLLFYKWYIWEMKMKDYTMYEKQ